MSRVRITVVGAGNWGRNHVRTLVSMPDVELAGIVDRDVDRAQSIAAEYGCRVMADVAELAGAAEAISVAVPTEFHRAVAVELLESGADVLVEKPIARTVEEADAILAAAERAGRLVMTGHTERFNPAVVALTAAVDRPRFIEIHRLAAFSARSTDIDVVLDLMILVLDLLLCLDGT